MSEEHAEAPAEEAPPAEVPVPKEPEPRWQAVRVRGELLHMPVYLPKEKAWLFKGDELKRWDCYPQEKRVAMGMLNWSNGEALTSPFMEIVPDEAPDLSASVLTMAGAAKLLGLASDRAARQFLKRHGIPFSLLGRQYLVRREAIEEFVKSRERAFAGGPGSSAAMRASEADRSGPVKRAFARRAAEARHHGKA